MFKRLFGCCFCVILVNGVVLNSACAQVELSATVLELPQNVPVPIFKDTLIQQQITKPNLQQELKQPNALQMLPNKKTTKETPFVHLPNATPQIDELIQKYADGYGVPVNLVRRIVKKESGGNPRAHHRNFYGLMQIAPATARAMGFRGQANELLDAETNLRFGVKYLRGAYLTAGGDETRTMMFYQRGYYYDAKAKGILEEVGFRAGPKAPQTVY